MSRKKDIYSQDPKGYYAILGVDPIASSREIKLNYRDRAKEWHPDHNKSEQALDKFQKLSVAYDILYDDEKRLIYDLFAEAYAINNFPQMDTLAVIKDRYGDENPFVRVFDLQSVIGKVIKYTFKDEKLICSQKQAGHEVLKCSCLNWLLGWWSIKAFPKNLKAIIENFKNTGTNTQDNLTLLVHNAVVFHKEGKREKAYLCAVQAMDYANALQRRKLEKFINILDTKSRVKIPEWHFTTLKLKQLIMPLILGMLLIYPFIDTGVLSKYARKEHEITYFQKVHLSSGDTMIDDLVVSRIFDIPVNLHDAEMFYHMTGDADIMYGPGRQFDVMKKIEKGHTVRLTGFTPDKKWYRIMLDSGEMGFVREKQITKGIGRPIPEFSKIKP